MEQSPPRTISRAVVRAVLGVALVLAAFQLVMMVPAWREWHAGTPDLYPGQHRGLFLGAVTGLALALALPIPIVLARLPKTRRGARAALWSAWGVLMALTVYGIWLRR